MRRVSGICSHKFFSLLNYFGLFDCLICNPKVNKDVFLDGCHVSADWKMEHFRKTWEQKAEKRPGYQTVYLKTVLWLQELLVERSQELSYNCSHFNNSINYSFNIKQICSFTKGSLQLANVVTQKSFIYFIYMSFYQHTTTFSCTVLDFFWPIFFHFSVNTENVMGDCKMKRLLCVSWPCFVKRWKNNEYRFI